MRTSTVCFGLLSLVAAACAAPSGDASSDDGSMHESEIRSEAGVTLASKGGLSFRITAFPEAHPQKEYGPIRIDVSRGSHEMTLGCTLDFTIARDDDRRRLEIGCEHDDLAMPLDIILQKKGNGIVAELEMPALADEDGPLAALWDPALEDEERPVLEVVKRSKAAPADVFALAEHVFEALEPLLEKKIKLDENDEARPVRFISFYVVAGAEPVTCGGGWMTSIDPFIGSLDTTEDVCLTENGKLVTPKALRERFEAALEKPE